MLIHYEDKKILVAVEGCSLSLNWLSCACNTRVGLIGA